MLLFIGSILVKIAEDAEFQYTSCYSLSSSASCFSFLLPGFNTSHVTLYLTAHEPDYPILKFQYISCYSLSLARI